MVFWDKDDSIGLDEVDLGSVKNKNPKLDVDKWWNDMFDPTKMSDNARKWAASNDFGDTINVRPSGGLSNQTRSVHAGTTSPFSNVIDFVTIATTGDAQNFGDLVEPQSLFAGASSSTRGVFGGGRNNTPSENTLHNTMREFEVRNLVKSKVRRGKLTISVFIERNVFSIDCWRFGCYKLPLTCF